MKLDLYLSESANLLGENRLIKMVLLVLAAVTVMNHFALEKVLRSSRTIVLPSVVPAKIEYTGATPDDGYFKGMAREISYLAFNYTPATARSNFSDLLRLYAPEDYGKGEAMWYDLAARIEEAQVSKAFQLTGIGIDHDRGRLVLHGQETEFTGGGASTSNRTYVVRFRLDRGRFLVLQVVDGEEEGRAAEKGEGRP
ncbi:MAG: TraE/TraK family type IV conjugative transfer system protein [Desulfobacteraceae bacterium]|nr:TraE/TraK family type IV conjugative transfer system protein [Desulfobacteraceae bacterium]